MNFDATLILPCRNEAAALVDLLPRIPADWEVIVVDNGSTDDTAAVARAHRVRVVEESQPGYGAAVHAGVLASTTRYVAVMDADGSFDPAEVADLLHSVHCDEVDLAVGRRRPVSWSVWPWHARLGNALVVAWLRRRIGLPIHDLAPLRVCQRSRLLELDVRDRRCGYPVELLQRATQVGWRFAEFDVAYHPRARGTKSKVSGSVVGTWRAARDFWRVLA